MPVTRRRFLAAIPGGMAGGALLAGCRRSPSAVSVRSSVMSDPASATASTRMPVMFIGHGSPMNAIEDNSWSQGFRALAGLLPAPKAILCVSAHWYVAGTFTTGNEHPKTIHDFGGFPDQLFAMEYPAPGAATLAQRVVLLFGSVCVCVCLVWGLVL